MAKMYDANCLHGALIWRILRCSQWKGLDKVERELECGWRLILHCEKTLHLADKGNGVGVGRPLRDRNFFRYPLDGWPRVICQSRLALVTLAKLIQDEGLC